MQRSFELTNENGNIKVYHTPTSRDPVGTLVCVHGGPGGDHRGNADVFNDLAGACGPLGYDIVQFDMYGAGDSDGTAAEITLATQLADYASVLEYARRESPSPIHVVGESMGATIAALDWQSDVTSYLLLWPAFDLRDTDLRPYLSKKWQDEAQQLGYIDDNGLVIGNEFIRELLQYDFSRCFQLPRTPCLLVHGKGDVAVPFDQSLAAVKQSAGECVLFAHPHADHGLQEKSERDFTRNAVLWWLSR